MHLCQLVQFSFSLETLSPVLKTKISPSVCAYRHSPASRHPSHADSSFTRQMFTAAPVAGNCARSREYTNKVHSRPRGMNLQNESDQGSRAPLCKVEIVANSVKILRGSSRASVRPSAAKCWFSLWPAGPRRCTPNSVPLHPQSSQPGFRVSVHAPICIPP